MRRFRSPLGRCQENGSGFGQLPIPRRVLSAASDSQSRVARNGRFAFNFLPE